MLEDSLASTGYQGIVPLSGHPSLGLTLGMQGLRKYSVRILKNFCGKQDSQGATKEEQGSLSHCVARICPEIQPQPALEVPLEDSIENSSCLYYTFP